MGDMASSSSHLGRSFVWQRLRSLDLSIGRVDGYHVRVALYAVPPQMTPLRFS